MNRLNLSAALLSLACLPHAAQAGEIGKKPVKAEARKSVDVAKTEHGTKVKAEIKPELRTARKSPASKAQQANASAQQVEALLAATLEPEVQVSPMQLEIAGRVLTGTADCELNQTVRVEPRADRPGHFRVAFRNATYTMVPEETSTGAVRLYDPRAGVVWLQIPTKSMLMNAKVGQRVVDACMQTEQRIAASAPASMHTASALGWSTPLPTALPMVAVLPATPASPALASSLALPASQASVPVQPVSALAATLPAVPAADVATLAVARAVPPAMTGEISNPSAAQASGGGPAPTTLDAPAAAGRNHRSSFGSGPSRKKHGLTRARATPLALSLGTFSPADLGPGRISLRRAQPRPHVPTTSSQSTPADFPFPCPLE